MAPHLSRLLRCRLRHTGRRTGFTIVELIVVMAIIVIIIAMLLPAFRSARHNAVVLRDISNMRQLQIAHWAYMTDHAGHLIDVGLSHNALDSDEAVAWVNTLEDYYDNAFVLKSPLDDSPHWPVELDGRGVPVPPSADRFRRTSYGCNDFLTRFNPIFDVADFVDPARVVAYNRLSRIRQPAAVIHTLHMAYTGAFAASDHIHTPDWWSPGMEPWQVAVNAYAQTQVNAARGPAVDRESVISGAVPGRTLARGESNYGFLDGHIETLPFGRVYIDFDRNLFDPYVAGAFSRYIDTEEGD